MYLFVCFFKRRDRGGNHVFHRPYNLIHQQSLEVVRRVETGFLAL